MRRHLSKGFVVAYMRSDIAARDGLVKLRHAGFRDDEVTVLPADEPSMRVSTLDLSDLMGRWGWRGALWGALFGIAVGAPAIFVPDDGVAKGWALAILNAGLEGALLGGGLGALAAGIYPLVSQFRQGPANAPPPHEAIVVARGPMRRLRRAERLLHEAGATEVQVRR